MEQRMVVRRVLGLLTSSVAALVAVLAAQGCPGDDCVVSGCSGQLCVAEPDDGVSTCEWSDTYACYKELGICEHDADGACGWRPTAELEACIARGGPDACLVTGCSGQVCADAPTETTCEWTDAYACYHDVGICERDGAGVCGWRQTAELAACLADPRTPATGTCVRNAGDACSEDADCAAGGCGGELCYNPALSNGASTCDCTTPAGATCGCLLGQCVWYE